MKPANTCITVFLDKIEADWLLSKSNEWHTSPSGVIRFLIQDYIDDMARLEEEENGRS